MPNPQEDYLAYLEQVRWKGIPTCPYCASTNSTRYKKERRYHCNHCFTSYSVTVGTLFHKTHVDLRKWLLAIRIMNDKSEEVSVRQLAQRIGVSKNTAHSMMQRIRKATAEQPQFFNEILKTLDSSPAQGKNNRTNT